jgi:hypothetical protein
MTLISKLIAHYLLQDEPVENTLRFLTLVHGDGAKVNPQIRGMFPAARSMDCTLWGERVCGLLDLFASSRENSGWAAWKSNANKFTTIVVAGPIDNEFLAGVYMDKTEARARQASLSGKAETRMYVAQVRSALALRRNVLTPFDNKEWI